MSDQSCPDCLSGHADVVSVSTGHQHHPNNTGVKLTPGEMEALIKAARLGRLRGKQFGYLDDRNHLINAQTKLVTALEQHYASHQLRTTPHQKAQKNHKMVQT